MGISQRTRKILWTRAANRCAICKRRLTADPQHSRDREAVLGSECHIIARRAGGPRGDATSVTALDAYSNLILLCPSDHRLVDDQPGAYPAERLLTLKRDHERWVDEVLDWRRALPDALWVRIKHEAEALILAEESESDAGVEELFEGLGVFVHATAEFLMAPELLLFIRAADGHVALAYRYTRGSVHVAHSNVEGFPTGFGSFLTAPIREDHTDKLDAGDDEKLEPFYAAAAGLRDVAKRISVTEAVMYIRGDRQAPELGFRYTSDTIELAAGPSRTFAAAFRSFATGNPADASHVIQLRMFVINQAKAFESDPLRCFAALVANLVANHVVSGLAGIIERHPDARLDHDELQSTVRDHAYESILILEVARHRPDDPLVRDWALAHPNANALGGLSAVLPSACMRAVNAHLAGRDLEALGADLAETSVDHVYEIIDLVARGADGDEPALLEELVSALPSSWADPAARVRLEELVDLTIPD